MKPAIVPVLCICWGLSCTSHEKHASAEAATDRGYTLTGEIDGLDSGWVYLLSQEAEDRAPDSALIINGSFLFQGELHEPAMYLLGIADNGNREYPLGFFLNDGQIHISAKRESISDALISGSPTQDEYRRYLESRKPINEEGAALRRSADLSVVRKKKLKSDSLDKALRVYDEKDKDFVRQYAGRHPASYVAAMLAYQKLTGSTRTSELDSIYSAFDSTIQQSLFGKKIKSAIIVARRTAVGSTAPDFKAQDASGTTVSLSSFKGKYVFLHFWASSCAPCRPENRDLARLYRRYHARGFDMIGVALDTNRATWLAAIVQDKLPGAQVSDLTGWKDRAAILYGVRNMPSNFLVDRQGKIVARDLPVAELRKTLADQIRKSSL